MKRLRILVGCERSGEVRNAFRLLGHDAWSCDLVRSDDNSPYHYVMDLLKLIKLYWDILICHPPCTHLAVSGARWFNHPAFPNKQQQQKQAIEFFLTLYNCNIPKVCIENPIGVMSTVFRKPDQIIQPWRFGHGERKATCLWLKNLPKLIEKPYVDFEPFDPDRITNLFLTIHNKEELSRLRSKTYHGIALAMADQWGGKVN